MDNSIWNNTSGMRLMNNMHKLWVVYKDDPFVLFPVYAIDRDTF
jgi:hypothetical protein